MEKLHVNDIFLDKIKTLIYENKNEVLKKELSNFHYADIAEIIMQLSLDEAIHIVKLLESDVTAEALAEVDESFREKILSKLSAKEIAEEIEELDTDDAADIVGELPEILQEKVLSKIEDTEHSQDIRELLNYEEGTAGALMAKELVSVNENLSVINCVREMRKQAKEVTRVHSIYVTNSKNKLLGRLSLKDLLTANTKAKVKDIYIPNVDFVNVNEDLNEIANVMSKYDLEAIPVVNDKKQLLGRITIDDVVDIIKEEADKDYQLAAGISKEVEANDNIFQLTRARLPWLFLGLIGGLGSVFILKDFEEIMIKSELRSLFFYTPLIAAMAGNVGVQSSAIIVQGIANQVIKGSLINRLFKEIGLGLINGLILSIVLIIFGEIINQDMLLSLTVAGSMMSVIIISALIGTFVPIILNKQGIDPAIATGPFITTANDIFGIFLFFYIAKLILGF
ncbi:MAG: magnesium transporter [Flavobacteriaceae bacterium]|nr:magnesium transporter [Flavobacteriaceae bacterium]|tara:strand:- start:193 stop:1551 length:1359 start_codon:yes stop_codon:yes gene_type:complete